MRVEETFAKFCSKFLEGVVLSDESVMIIFDPVVYFDVLEGHEDTSYFFFVGDFTLVKVGVKVLDELCENGRGNMTRCEDWGGFVTVVVFYRCHVLERRVRSGGRHNEDVVVR